MNIEELIDRLSSNRNYSFSTTLGLFPADIIIIDSLSEQVQKDSGFTEKQRTLALKLVKKYTKILSFLLKYDVNIDLVNPTFKYPIRKLNNRKSVEVKTFETDDTKILVKFPYHEGTIAAFKQYTKTFALIESSEIGWSIDDAAWMFPFIEPNVSFLSKLLGSDFTFDERFLDVIKDIIEIEDNIDQYVPMVVFQDGQYFYKNTSNKIPQPSSTNLTEVLLNARRYGITHWDESIDSAMSSISPTVRKFLINSTCNLVISDSTELSDINELLQNFKNVLFVIPGGTELAHLKTVHHHLKRNNIPNEQLTVMFRLDSNAGKICNDYIKENKLNGIISDNIKFVCISGKIPKPLIESGKQFDLIVHFGTNSAHYTLTNYIKNHHNVISMSLNNKNRELNFDKL